MGFPQDNSVTVTTDSGGAATVYLDAPDGNGWRGRLITLIYTKTDFSNGSTFLITSERTGQTLWSETSVNASTARQPGQVTHDTLGTAQSAYDYIRLAGERIKIVITGGGNGKIGAFKAIVE